MAEETKIFTLEELIGDVDGKEYRAIPYGKGQVMIGSLSSADMLTWLESNDDPATRRTAGLRLIARSIVDPTTHAHVPETDYEAVVEKFRKKDARQNGKLVEAILALNGLDRVRTTVDAAKND